MVSSVERYENRRLFNRDFIVWRRESTVVIVCYIAAGDLWQWRELMPVFTSSRD